MSRYLRSFVAVSVGTVTTVSLVIGATYVAAWAMLDPSPEGLGLYATPPFTMVCLGWSFPAAMVGGWMGAAISARRVVLHGAASGVLLLLPLAWTRAAPGPGQPAWYAWIFAVVILLGSIAGATLRSRTQRGDSP